MQRRAESVTKFDLREDETIALLRRALTRPGGVAELEPQTAQALLNELYLRFVTLYSTGEQLLRQLRAEGLWAPGPGVPRSPKFLRPSPRVCAANLRVLVALALSLRNACPAALHHQVDLDALAALAF